MCVGLRFAAASCATAGSLRLRPKVPEQACMANRPDNEVELHRLEMRFAATRVEDRRAVQRLACVFQAIADGVSG